MICADWYKFEDSISRFSNDRVDVIKRRVKTYNITSIMTSPEIG